MANRLRPFGEVIDLCAKNFTKISHTQTETRVCVCVCALWEMCRGFDDTTYIAEVEAKFAH
jgi:hypothetical protein